MLWLCSICVCLSSAWPCSLSSPQFVRAQCVLPRRSFGKCTSVRHWALYRALLHLCCWQFSPSLRPQMKLARCSPSLLRCRQSHRSEHHRSTQVSTMLHSPTIRACSISSAHCCISLVLCLWRKYFNIFLNLCISIHHFIFICSVILIVSKRKEIIVSPPSPPRV